MEVTLPLRVQPVQLYFEMAGEDQRPSMIPYPTKYAYLYGIFLPSILGNPSIDLRVEYADNQGGAPGKEESDFRVGVTLSRQFPGG